MRLSGLVVFCIENEQAEKFKLDQIVEDWAELKTRLILFDRQVQQ